MDAFLERTAADRQRLQDDLAQLEAALAGHDVTRQQELERLAALRRELARCLETSINALHVADLLLVPPAVNEQAPAPGTAVWPERSSAADPQPSWPLPAWLSPARTLALVAIVPAAVVMLSALAGAPRIAQYGQQAASLSVAGTPTGGAAQPVAALEPFEDTPPSASSGPIGAPVAVVPSVSATASSAATDTPAAPAADGLVLTLTALNECWIRSTIDGGEPRERLLKANQSMTLRASDEAVLRIGDPAALRLEINGRPAKALGPAGRVVTARVTRANFLEYLSGN
ncbi:MAG TPA: RodZ domain-containing protein [Vicinamibacterales bacterium]|nr:RodZ domain-containing protein [Vicinamibacterales bacterium]